MNSADAVKAGPLDLSLQRTATIRVSAAELQLR